jgi:hypothetical protein
VILFVFLNQGELGGGPQWLLYAGLGAFVIAAFVVLFAFARRRTKRMQQASTELGLSFAQLGTEESMGAFFEPLSTDDKAKLYAELNAIAANAPPTLQASLKEKLTTAMSSSNRGIGQSELRRLVLFRDVERPRTHHVMAGNAAGYEAVLFDYSYDVKRADTSKNPGFSVSQTVAAFRFRGRDLPAFEVSPHGTLERMLPKTPIQDVNFDSHPDFSRRFQLQCEDERPVRNLFQPALLHSFETLGDGFGYTVEGRGECVVVYKPGRLVDPGAIAPFWREAAAVAAAVGERAPRAARTT